MEIYLPLYRWLVAQPTDVRHITVTFQQIEGILGFDLPGTARTNPAWWANNSNHHSQAKAWLDVGFLTQQVNVVKETLTFSRDNLN
jgi:hypothetical protein